VDPIAQTARWTAAIRAKESAREDRLFDDPFAATLAGEEGIEQLNRVDAGDNPFVLIRTRFFDDFLTRANRNGGIGQVVIVAAGMDTRAFRLDWAPGTQLYELDRPGLLALKDDLLAPTGAQPLRSRHVVGVDLAQPWAQALLDAGFDAQAPSAWLVQGLVQYLPEEAVRNLLQELSGLAATGSVLGADLVSRSLLDSPYMKEYLKTLEERGSPWIFGTDEPEALLAQYGWQAEVVQPGEEGANFGRWQYPVAPRSTPGIPRSYLVTAQKVQEQPGGHLYS
jgi:methyltransferase (TIGR00027 family)